MLVTLLLVGFTLCCGGLNLRAGRPGWGCGNTYRDTSDLPLLLQNNSGWGLECGWLLGWFSFDEQCQQSPF